MTRLTTTLCALAVMSAAHAGSTQDSKALGGLMYTDIDAPIEQMSIQDVVRVISQASGVHVVLLASTEQQPSGIDPALIVNLPARHRPALNLLQDALEACGSPEPTTWQIRDGMVEVSTKDRLATETMQTTRVLPIEEFIQPIPDYNDPPNLNLGGGGGGSGGGGGGGAAGGGGGGGAPNWDELEETKRQQLIEVMIRNIEPGGWKRQGGEWAEMMPNGRSLVIRAPRWIQRQIFGFDFGTPRMAGKPNRSLRFEGDQVRVEVSLTERLKREAGQ